MEEVEKEVLADRLFEVATEGVLQDHPSKVAIKGEVVPSVVESIPTDPSLSSPSRELVPFFKKNIVTFGLVVLSMSTYFSFLNNLLDNLSGLVCFEHMIYFELFLCHV